MILNCGSQTVVPEEVNSKRAKQMQPSAVTTSKVGELDEALLVDQPYLKGLGNLMKKVFKSVDNNDLIFPFAMYEAVRKFNLVVKKFGLEKVGGGVHLSDPPRISQHGCTTRSSHFGADSTSRKVADTKKCETLLQRGAGLTGVCKPRAKAQNQSTRSRAVDGRDFRSVPVNLASRYGVGLELFSGCGRLTKSIRRQLKQVFCIEVDIVHGPQFDLCKQTMQKENYRFDQIRGG